MAPCLPHPHPVPGQSRAAASASLHFGVCSVWGGHAGHLQSPACPVQPEACSPPCLLLGRAWGCFARCPFAAWSLVGMSAWLPSFLGALSLSSSFSACYGSPFLASPPSPSRRRQLHFQPCHCWLSQPSLLPRAGTKNGGLGGVGMWASGGLLVAYLHA